MRQYSVMLVDDEEDVIEIIRRKLNWEEMGFCVTASAHNGVEALETAEELQPDVVMTDIKMPYMDGLTLARKLKEQNPKVKIIIFSGFDEFEYAKEAIKLEAEEYLLKPVNADELNGVFARIKQNLDKEIDEEQNIDKLKNYYIESLPILQENFYTSLLRGQIKPDRIGSLIVGYQIDLKGPYYTTVLLHISSSDVPDDMDSTLLNVSVKRLAAEQLSDRWRAKIVTWFTDIVLIAQLENEEEMTALTDDCDRFCRTAKKFSRATVTAGIGHVVPIISDLSKSFEGADSAVSYRMMYGTGKAINIAEIDPHENAEIPSAEDGMQNVFHRIKTGTTESVDEAVRQLVDSIIQARSTIQQYRLLVMEMIADIFRFGNNNHLNMEDVFGKNNDVYSEALSIDSPSALVAWLYDISIKMQQLIVSERQSSTRSFVDKAEDYVKDNYADKELTIESICNYLGVSSAYFSTVFKKETGKTFINYLTEIRMKKAVELLIDQNEKTYIIAEKTGYADPNYFSYVFKKQYGMSPSKYKAAMKQDSGEAK
ncbi:MAG: response regulator [Lachnospiraceae bacterium]|nr:response regulator [Lachnospiraceae bacterium]MCR5775945.1 response regulator [Lachnospiraceae bacterium]